MVREMLSTDDVLTLFFNSDQCLCLNGSNLRFSFCFGLIIAFFSIL